MYVPITTFNIGYPVERPWKRLPYYYSTIPTECKRENKVFQSVFQLTFFTYL